MGKRLRQRLRGTITSSSDPIELFSSPNDFSSSDWTKIGCTITAGQSDPDGGTDAYLLTSTGTGRIRQVITLEVGKQYRFQGKIKAMTTDITSCTIYMQDNGSPFTTNSFRTGVLDVADGWVTVDEIITAGGSLNSKRVDLDVGTADLIVLYQFSLTEV